MVPEVVRFGAGLIAPPILHVARSIRRAVAGDAVVIEVVVRRQVDVRAREHYVRMLRRLGREATIKAVLLRFESTPGGWAASQDFRAAIAHLKEKGKGVYAVLEAPGNGAMWLASACDRVFIQPMGEVGLLGVGAELTFFGAALERLGVQPDFEAAGAYKSFGESYTRSFASIANQEAIGSLVADLNAQLLQGIADGRGLSLEQVNAALEEAPLSASDAVDVGLVDQLAYEDEVHDWLDETVGEHKRVEFDKWVKVEQAIDQLERSTHGGKYVAVVHLDGGIVMEKKGARGTSIQARRVVPELRKLRERDDVAAVVLNINSPGGSALASDLMWREIDLLAKDMPVVAVFEDVSASGGFYLAAPAHRIVARPGTLTGSIGVFGGKMVLGEGMRKLGVHAQQVSESPNAHVYSATRAFTQAQRVRFKASLQRFYDGFVSRVASGRKRPVDEVEPHCRGRVWTGSEALDNGLIDEYGDLRRGLELAAELVEGKGALRRLDISTAPRRSPVQWAMSQAMPGAASLAVPPLFQGLVSLALGGRSTASLELLMDHPGEPMAMLPFDLELR